MVPGSCFVNELIQISFGHAAGGEIGANRLEDFIKGLGSCSLFEADCVLDEFPRVVLGSESASLCLFTQGREFALGEAGNMES